MADFIYRAEVDSDGKLAKIHNSRSFYNDLKLFSGQTIQISFKKFRKSRTERQNKFYFGNYVESQIECFKGFWGGVYTREQIHDWNKNNIFCEEHLVGDEIIKVPKSSTEHSTVSWEESLEIGREFFRSRFNWELPYPNSQSEMDL